MSGTRRHRDAPCQGIFLDGIEGGVVSSADAASFPLLILCLALAPGSPGAATDKCRTGASALSDAKAIAGVRGAINRQCPCADYDGTTPAKRHSAYVKCASEVVNDATDGTALLGAFTLRDDCRRDGDAHLFEGGVRLRGDVAARHVLRGEAGERQDEGRREEGDRCVSSSSGSGDPPRVPRVAVRARRVQLRRDELRARRSSCRRPSTSRSAAAPAETPGTPASS
jgi:hypothetical protein